MLKRIDHCFASFEQGKCILKMTNSFAMINDIYALALLVHILESLVMDLKHRWVKLSPMQETSKLIMVCILALLKSVLLDQLSKKIY